LALLYSTVLAFVDLKFIVKTTDLQAFAVVKTFYAKDSFFEPLEETNLISESESELSHHNEEISLRLGV
jgi:hypothetical protein